MSEQTPNSPPLYITTPIYYVNDRPHIGHAYTTTVCDVYARFMRFAGRDVFFLTGTDEHGVKVEKSARERGVSPQELADENAAEFQKALGMFGLTNDDFIRTTEPRHERQVQAMIRRLTERDAVYLGEFEGWYDEGQEEYLTEGKAKECDYKSPVSGRPLVRMKESNYYFRLSAFQDQMEKLFRDHPDFVRPGARRNEVVSRVKEGLQDVPMSRTTFSWGVEWPDDPEHVVYVWIDALSNYITALGLLDDGGADDGSRSKYWPAEYHVIGKEILWFHAVIWPAMLMALDLPLPKCVYAHSFWICEGQKMSKSLGNFIDLPTIQSYLDAYSLDAWRYYMATQGPLGAQDADFTAEHFQEVYTTDLVNTVGNSASRVTAMITKYFDGRVPSESAGDGARITIEGFDWPAECGRTVEQSAAAMARLDLNGSIGAAMALIRRVDAFINATEPFKIAKDESKRDELGAILYQCLESLRIASLPLWAVMPEKMAAMWAAFGQSVDPAAGKMGELAKWGRIEPGTTVEKVAHFPRVEPASVGAPG